MAQHIRILIVEDSESWQRRLLRHLGRIGEELEADFDVPDVAGSLAEAERLLETHRYDLATIDINLEADNPNNRDGLAVLKIVHDQGIQAIIVRASGEDNPEASHDIIETTYAPVDYLLKDQFYHDRFKRAVSRALARNK